MKVRRRRMSLMCIKNDMKVKRRRMLQHLTGQDSNNLVHMMLSQWKKKKNKVLQRNTFENHSVLLKENKDVNDLIHLSPKQILTLTTFHKVN
jgi:hypothetical protein